jgi:CheY-like chemotaxis protein
MLARTIGQDGYRFRRQNIPIVFITALRDETSRPRSLDTGGVQCLFKPFGETPSSRRSTPAAVTLSTVSSASARSR